MPTSPSNRLVNARFQRSLESAHARRAAEAAAGRERDRRRRRLMRLPAPGVALVLAASLVGVSGLDAAAAHVHRTRTVAAYRSLGLLTVGSQGPRVAALQRALGLRGDGIFTSATRRAVLRFQRRNGLAVDGVAGPQTLGALGLSAAAPAAGPGEGTSASSASRSSGVAATRSGTSGSASGSSVSGSTRSGSAGSGLLGRIAQCESGGNPAAVSGDGRFRGKYQFTRETWRSLGGSGDPAAASGPEQDRLAARLLASGGRSAWPSCAR